MRRRLLLAAYVAVLAGPVVWAWPRNAPRDLRSAFAGHLEDLRQEVRGPGGTFTPGDVILVRELRVSGLRPDEACRRLERASGKDHGWVWRPAQGSITGLRYRAGVIVAMARCERDYVEDWTSSQRPTVRTVVRLEEPAPGPEIAAYRARMVLGLN